MSLPLLLPGGPRAADAFTSVVRRDLPTKRLTLDYVLGVYARDPRG